MIMYEPDPDLLRWGLHLLHGDPLFNIGCCEIPIESVNSFENGVHASESNFGTDHTNVENDEILAHALQEELSQIASREASGSSLAVDELSQASVLAQDWLDFSAQYTHSGTESVSVAMDGMEPYLSPGEDSNDENMWTIEIADGSSTLDGEVGKRLNQMVPIPHVPRINGEIPSVDEATSDHQRLLDRLQLYELIELKVQGDGNCQFRALSDQFYRSPEHHKFVRQQVVNQLKSHPEIYEGYVPMAYDEYLEKMSKSGEWGDHVTLQAAADSVF
ncbi:Ubiquitinyl hydrolase 1 protein [Dioscorea alata]|uniref:Ubiquitinyl hydrolase 1 protein n=1 Tax=Dioscorea alata TaxID=55571 RepID=A0ACB7UQ53_DIOAL|nr:Ubiquitinyl hydrolase 1 protein [Dioscorea alata]